MRSQSVLSILIITILLPTAASHGADRELDKFAHELRQELPVGWQLSKTDTHLIVRRARPVKFYNAISLPAFASDAELKAYVKDGAYDEDYMIVLRFGSKIMPMQYEQWQRENRQAAERYEELARSVRDITHKFDQYLPSNKEEKERVAAFEKAVEQIPRRELPDHFHGRYSVYVETTQDWTAAFYDEDVAQECRRVRRLVVDRFRDYAD